MQLLVNINSKFQ